ncbi:MAG: sugar transferase [Candidatus ainarchaeum sp.]|nr:sugar transferase [Candidatus ainarchaeum sp.]
MQNRRRQAYGSIFRQERVGKMGKPITITKLRTMRMGSETSAVVARPGPWHAGTRHGKRSSDPRVIPSKKWLRRFWIDELPQVVSLIRGDLRLIGTRAQMPKNFETLPEWMKQKYLEYGPSLIPLEAALGKMPGTEAELKKAYETYFAEKAKRPGYTDFRYFVRFAANALRGRIRGI